MSIIGRKSELDHLNTCCLSGRPEFVAVYGRRRVGKTFLIREYFNYKFSFYATGVTGMKTREQLATFNDSLIRYGCKEKKVPSDWLEAFSRLRDLLESPDVYRDPLSDRRVVFLDELPWMDTARSGFKMALDYFWNSWASAQADLMLIVCGSAASWIIDNLLRDTGGFYNRVTRRIHLAPFTLGECEELLRSHDMILPRKQILEAYMVFGGIPYYLIALDRRLSIAQNIDELCFSKYGELRYEYDNLFRSLYRNPEKHFEIVEALSKTRTGMTRNQLAAIDSIGGGSALTKALEELEQCGFIRKYIIVARSSTEHYFQLVDHFMIFSLKFLKQKEPARWMEYIATPAYNAWRGNAFEVVCINHIDQIKEALRIPGVITSEYSWRSANKEDGAQIDLLIDRRDGVINLCEMKCTDGEYEMTKSDHDRLIHRQAAFIDEMKPSKAVHLTLVTANGLKWNKYSASLINVITGEDLFR